MLELRESGAYILIAYIAGYTACLFKMDRCVYYCSGSLSHM